MIVSCLPPEKHHPRDLSKLSGFLTLNKNNKCILYIREIDNVGYCRLCKASTKKRSVNYTPNLLIFYAYTYRKIKGVFGTTQMITIANFCTDCYMSNFVVPLSQHIRFHKWDEDNLQLKIHGDFDKEKLLDDLLRWRKKCRVSEKSQLRVKYLKNGESRKKGS